MKPERENVSKTIRILYIFLGFTTFTLGTIGIVLPVLPTVPFYLLTMFFFARGSRRFEEWFTHSNFYKNHVQEFAETRSMTITRIISLMVFSSTVLLTTIYLVDPVYLKVLVLAIMVFKYYYFYNYVNIIQPKKSE